RITATAGRDTLVVDAEPAGFGASTRLAGYIGRFLHYSIQKLESKVGKEKAHRLWKESGDAQWVLLDLIEKEQMEVGKLYRGRFTGACSPAHYEAMATNAEYINKNVPFEYSMCPASEQHKEVGTDFWHGGMILHEHGTLHPGLYHQGLMDAAIRAGARIEGRTPVLDIAPEPGGGFTVTTRHHAIRARDVVICTNGYSNTQRSAVPWVRNRIVPVYAHQICTDTISDGLMKDVKPSGRAVLDSKTNIFWDRPTPDDKRIIFGARTGHDDGDLRITAKKLRDLMVMVYPQLAETKISHVWRGVMGFSFDHLPHTGQTRDGVYFATGFCGSGLPLGTYFGQKVGHKLVGNPEGETEWWNHGFPPGRSTTAIPGGCPPISAGSTSTTAAAAAAISCAAARINPVIPHHPNFASPRQPQTRPSNDRWRAAGPGLAQGSQPALQDRRREPAWRQCQGKPA
ncbi:MAG: FAD-binding oxidoreductase, partial [Alphaproteobacteria bacterium]|nr:FAD-binding oxidoreductase [Alphaproteobacteria bacterium]